MKLYRFLSQTNIYYLDVLLLPFKNLKEKANRET